MPVTDQQVRKLMEEYRKQQKVGVAAMRAGMDRKTARKYLAADKLPSELKEPRHCKTREDPFKEDWPFIEEILRDLPEVEGVHLFDHLVRRHPDRYQEGQLRTLQRRMKQWRATQGPPKELFLPQEHRPGEALQTDFTWANELEVTIAGEPFEHKLCHPVLPYSNWEWATVCRSESMVALRRGVQDALFELTRVPIWHQTDNSTAATHDLRTGKRGFNEEYLALVNYFGMKPRTTGVGEKEQNGDVEALNGALKRRLNQLLLLRGSRDFESESEYERWIQDWLRNINRTRRDRTAEELAVMEPLQVKRLPEFREERVRVSSGGMIRVKSNSYSVPSQLKGEHVRVRVYESRLEVYYGDTHQFTVERLQGSGHHRVNYRHVVDTLVKKPGAFERYRYRDDLFPSATFREAYEALCEKLSRRRATIEYVRCLELAAKSFESEVEAVLRTFLDSGQTPEADKVRDLVSPAKPEIPEVVREDVELVSYDALIESEKEAS